MLFGYDEMLVTAVALGADGAVGICLSLNTHFETNILLSPPFIYFGSFFTAHEYPFQQREKETECWKCDM
jgi:hypothetical protein